jgi:predicted metal-dependent phosphoesterase TrpH
MLKCDFHIHVNEDPSDVVPYNARQLIDRAAEIGYDVLAITCHDYVCFDDDLVAYAKARGILLIPGAEKTLQGKHVLLYNVNNFDIESVKTFQDLAKLKKKKNVVAVAAHPYYVFSQCLGKLLEKHIDLFDGIEYSHYHTYLFNLNRKAVRMGKKYGKTLVGTSDSHRFSQFGTTYSLVDSDKNLDAVLDAIREGKVNVVSPPLNPFRFISITGFVLWSTLKRKLGLSRA